MKRVCASRAWAAAVLGWLAWSGAAADEPVITPQQIEADWLRQDHVRSLPVGQVSNLPARPVSTRDDAAGACDGLKDGTYGFHTSADDRPWWQVDLGRAVAIDRVAVFNRCDGNVEDRAARLTVLLSADGKTWTELYRHDGSKFFGQTDGKPLVAVGRGAQARFVRLQLPERQYFHLDEVEVYAVGAKENVALNRPADQSSTSQWSKAHGPPQEQRGEATAAQPEPDYPVARVLQSGRRLAEDLRRRGVDVGPHVETLDKVGAALAALPSSVQTSEVSKTSEVSEEVSRKVQQARRDLYFQARWAVRRMALSNPLVDFDAILFVKRVPGSFTHMSDQYYGWFSRPGGGLYVLEGFKSSALPSPFGRTAGGEGPRLRCLTEGFAPGSFLRPDLSHDAKRVLFAYCRYCPGLAGHPDKLNKDNVPEDAFYHLYEMNVDGTGVRRLTRGKYDHFDGRYLPSGEIVFLSTRRGQHVQCGKAGAADAEGQAPDSYVRCGGGPERPVAVYTLHVMDAQGKDLRQISAFEMFEWTPAVDDQGRVLYARWDYVDRHNMPYMGLWSTMPDGTSAQAVFGNFTRNPHCLFEARQVPGSRKIVCTASGHHAFTGGSLVLLDYSMAADGDAAVTRLTPEVCFPESEGWPQTYFAGPYPLADEHYLVAWSDKRLPPGVPLRPGGPWGEPGPPNDLGLYLFDAFGNLELLYRDPAISSETPIPLRPRPRPPVVHSQVDWDGPQEGQMLLLDAHAGLAGVPPGTVRRLRIVGVPPKTHPTMNHPALGLTHDDPGKFVLGTVPVEEDGSAFFRAPSGVTLFFQALDQDGVAVQTMRSGAYVQPGQTVTCIGCHEPRRTAPPNVRPQALRRGPSRIAPGPEGSWPLDYRELVQPVLDKHCVSCHKPGGQDEKFDLTAPKSYDAMVDYGTPSLRAHVTARYSEGRSKAGQGAAATSPLVKLLKQGHYDVKLAPGDWERLVTWMDTYGQRLGSFGEEQAEHLRELKKRWEAMLER